MSNQIGWYTMKDQGEWYDDLRRINCFCKQKYVGTQQLQGQLEILHKIKWSRFKNVVAIYDYYQKNQETVYVFMEKCNFDLSTYNQNLKEKKKNLQFYQDLISQVSSGYLELQGLQIIHRDIKPDNILVVEQNNSITYKICDFDISKNEEDVQRMKTDSKQGTISYSAPEIKESKYSYAADMFSFGLTIFQLLAGDNNLNQSQNKLNSFFTQLQSKSFEEILQEQQIKLNIDASESSQIIKILNRMIVYQPGLRISWEDLNKNIYNQEEFQKNIINQQQRNCKTLQSFEFQKMPVQHQYQQSNNFKNQLNNQFPPAKNLILNNNCANWNSNKQNNINFNNIPNSPCLSQQSTNQIKNGLQMRANYGEDKNFNQQMNYQYIKTPIQLNQPGNDQSKNQKSNEQNPFSQIQNQKHSNQIFIKQNFTNQAFRDDQQRQSVDSAKYIINSQLNQQRPQQSKQQNRSISVLKN